MRAYSLRSATDSRRWSRKANQICQPSESSSTMYRWCVRRSTLAARRLRFGGPVFRQTGGSRRPGRRTAGAPPAPSAGHRIGRLLPVRRYGPAPVMRPIAHPAGCILLDDVPGGAFAARRLRFGGPVYRRTGGSRRPRLRTAGAPPAPSARSPDRATTTCSSVPGPPRSGARSPTQPSPTDPEPNSSTASVFLEAPVVEEPAGPPGGRRTTRWTHPCRG
jgi:hypothetical protein